VMNGGGGELGSAWGYRQRRQSAGVVCSFLDRRVFVSEERRRRCPGSRWRQGDLASGMLAWARVLAQSEHGRGRSSLPLLFRTRAHHPTSGETGEGIRRAQVG